MPVGEGWGASLLVRKEALITRYAVRFLLYLDNIWSSLMNSCVFELRRLSGLFIRELALTHMTEMMHVEFVDLTIRTVDSRDPYFAFQATRRVFIS